MDVAVVIPAFNAAATLGESLDSVLSQDLPPKQIIVVDDGSTDDTPEIARRFSGVTLIRQENAGVAAAMNTGLEQVRAEAVTILDADDLFPPGRLSRQISILSGDRSLAGVLGETEEFVCPSLDPAPAARLLPRPRQLAWLNAAALLRMDAFTQVGRFAPALRVGAWVDWVDRARKLNLRFAIDHELALRRRLRPGTLSSSQSRDTAFLEVARRALARRRSETE